MRIEINTISSSMFAFKVWLFKKWQLHEISLITFDLYVICACWALGALIWLFSIVIPYSNTVTNFVQWQAPRIVFLTTNHLSMDTKEEHITNTKLAFTHWSQRMWRLCGVSLLNWKTPSWTWATDIGGRHIHPLATDKKTKQLGLLSQPTMPGARWMSQSGTSAFRRYGRDDQWYHFGCDSSKQFALSTICIHQQITDNSVTPLIQRHQQPDRMREFTILLYEPCWLFSPSYHWSHMQQVEMVGFLSQY